MDLKLQDADHLNQTKYADQCHSNIWYSPTSKKNTDMSLSVT